MSQYVYWTRERILAAIVDWNRRYGRPPAAREWIRSSAVNPTVSTVRLNFGTWNDAIEAAGFTPRRRGGPPGGNTPLYWTKERILEAIARWTAEHGRPPRWKDWQKSGVDHPHASSVTREFRTFRAAIKAAQSLTDSHMVASVKDVA